MQSETIACHDLLPDIASSEVEKALSRLDQVARAAVQSSLTEDFVISFSGGIDSSILAFLAADIFQKQVKLLVVGREGSKDIIHRGGSLFQKDKRFRLESSVVDISSIRLAAKAVADTVQVGSLSHLEDCVAFYLIGKELSMKQGARVIASANGPDELFCGYDRFRRILDESGQQRAAEEINIAINAAFSLKHQVRKVLAPFGLGSSEPFLERRFVDFCSENIPMRLKILEGNDRLRKRIWRAYGRSLGLPDDIVKKPKQAMQFSMGIHPVISSMLRKGEISISRGKVTTAAELGR